MASDEHPHAPIPPADAEAPGGAAPADGATPHDRAESGDADGATPGDGAEPADAEPGDAAPAAGAPRARRRTGPAQWRLLVMVALAVVAALGTVLVVGLMAEQRGRAAAGGVAPPAGRATAPDTPPLLRDAGGEPQPLPDATLPPLADLGPAGGLELSQLRGEPAVINFWASWCAPCVREMPGLQAVADDLGITVVGVDYVDQEDEAVALARELGITYPLVRDDDGEFGRKVGLMGTPTTLFVDADGMIVRQIAAELSADELREVIARELR